LHVCREAVHHANPTSDQFVSQRSVYVLPRRSDVTQSHHEDDKRYKNDEKYMVGLLLMLLALSTAQAQTTIDAAKITCEEFVTAKTTIPDNIALSLSGYYHGKRAVLLLMLNN
jgi:hypothetical protein